MALISIIGVGRGGVRRGRSHAILALALASALAGCGTVGLFGTYDVPESEGVAEAPYPRLVDVPEAPASGEFGPGVPDPAVGVATQADLAAAAAEQNARAARVSQPVLTEADRRALGR